MTYALAEKEQELEALDEGLVKIGTRDKREISAEKTKLMTNSVNAIQKEIKVKGQKLSDVTSSKYIKAFVADNGCRPRVLHRFAQAAVAIQR